MIKKEDMIKKYQDSIIIDDEDIATIVLYIDTIIEKKYYSTLFIAEKKYNKKGESKTTYSTVEDPVFEELFKDLGREFIYFDENILRKFILKYISSSLKKGEIISEIKEKIIADALVENDLDDEDEYAYELSKVDMFDIIVSDDAFSKMIKKSFTFNQEEYEKTETRNNLIKTYRRIKEFIANEIKEATEKNEKKRIKELKKYQKFFDEFLLTRIYRPSDIILTEAYLTNMTEFKKEDIQVKDIIPNDIKESIINKINMNIHISLDDVYDSIDDSHKEEDFYEEVLYNEDKIINKNDFSKRFVNICLSICKKEDGTSYTKQEIIIYLLRKVYEHKKCMFKDRLPYEDSISYYDDCNIPRGSQPYNEDYYYNGYEYDEDFTNHDSYYYYRGISKNLRGLK